MLRELAPPGDSDEDGGDDSDGSAAAALEERDAAQARAMEAAVKAADAARKGVPRAPVRRKGMTKAAPQAAPPPSTKGKGKGPAAPKKGKKLALLATNASRTGEGSKPTRAQGELAGPALTLAVRREVTARTIALFSNPQDADDVFLCNDDARAMYIASIMAVAPASMERAEELARQVAAVNARPKKEETSSATRTTDILGQCAQARSTAYHSLCTWVWSSWTAMVEYESTEVDYRGNDESKRTAAIGMWWLKGRRYLNTKSGRAALYNLCAAYINRYGMEDAYTDQYHKGRRVLSLLLAVIALIVAKVWTVPLCCVCGCVCGCVCVV